MDEWSDCSDDITSADLYELCKVFLMDNEDTSDGNITEVQPVILMDPMVEPEVDVAAAIVPSDNVPEALDHHSDDDDDDDYDAEDYIPLKELATVKNVTVQPIADADVSSESEDDIPLNALRGRLIGEAERSFAAEEDAPPDESIPMRGRKRSKPDCWERNVRKSARNRGESYISARGVTKSARKVLRPRCAGKCSRVGLKCDEVNEDSVRSY